MKKEKNKKKIIIILTITALLLTMGILSCVVIDSIFNISGTILEEHKEKKELEELKEKSEKILKVTNEYSKNKDYIFVQKTTKNEVESYQDLLNVIYSVFDNRIEKIYVVCSTNYIECSDDITKISNDSNLLSNINNFVHPYNTYTKIGIYTTPTNEITINVTYKYTKEDINKIEIKANEIIKEYIKDDMTDYDKIKTLHDYIINNTRFSCDEEIYGNKIHDARGPLFDSISCSNGYVDLLAVLLDKLGIENSKIASNTHIWNIVKLEDKWLHLDAAWDDPIDKNNPDKDYLLYDFFLKNTEEWLSKNNEGLIFDQNIYIELSIN